MPDSDALGRSRDILSKDESQEKSSAQVLALLTDRRSILKRGTIADPTLIAAPSPAKNREKK